MDTRGGFAHGGWAAAGADEVIAEWIALDKPRHGRMLTQQSRDKRPPTMQSNRTKSHKISHILTPNQRTAIELLASGKNDREVAERIRVRRETVCQWRHDPDFAAELEVYRRELWSPYTERLQSLIPRVGSSMQGGVRHVHE